jgi:hypothetical protein
MVLASITGIFMAYGQSTYGTVTRDLKPLNGAMIKNLHSRNIAISGRDGKFVLKLNKGDTLLTIYMGLKTDTLTFNYQSPLLITLKPSSNMLGEVVIRDSRISPLEKFRNAQHEYKQIYRIGDNSNIFSLGAGYGIFFSINIDKLYSALSKEGRDARRLQRTLIRDYHSDIVDTRFTESLITKLTGYEGRQLDSFMINNRPSYDFIKNASDYDLIKYIKQKAGETVLPKDTTIITKKE